MINREWPIIYLLVLVFVFSILSFVISIYYQTISYYVNLVYMSIYCQFF